MGTSIHIYSSSPWAIILTLVEAGVSRKQAQAHGLAIFKWLADHDEAHVHILMGNHDLCRVMELYALSDEAFDEAHALACAGDGARLPTNLSRSPPMGVVARDFSAFCVAQRRCSVTLDGKAGQACPCGSA